jgi:hypothetical protein
VIAKGIESKLGQQPMVLMSVVSQERRRRYSAPQSRAAHQDNSSDDDTGQFGNNAQNGPTTAVATDGAENDAENKTEDRRGVEGEDCTGGAAGARDGGGFGPALSSQSSKQQCPDGRNQASVAAASNAQRPTRAVLTNRILAFASANPTASSDELVAILVRDPSRYARCHSAKMLVCRTFAIRDPPMIAPRNQPIERAKPIKRHCGGTNTTPQTTTILAMARRRSLNPFARQRMICECFAK